MGLKPGLHEGRRIVAVAGAVIIIVMLATLTSGCAPNSPEAATKAFYNAIENGDWNAYIDSILPERVRMMTPEEKEYTEESVEDSGVTFEGLKFETKYTNKDKTEATVSIVAGEMSQENPSTGEKEVVTIEEVIEQSGTAPEVNTVKYKNRWYVDVPLSQADMQQESEIQMEETPSGNQ